MNTNTDSAHWARDERGTRVPLLPLWTIVGQVAAAGRSRRDAMRHVAAAAGQAGAQLARCIPFDDAVSVTDADVWRRPSAEAPALRGTAGAWQWLAELAEARSGPAVVDDLAHPLAALAMPQKEAEALFPCLAAHRSWWELEAAERTEHARLASGPVAVRLLVDLAACIGEAARRQRLSAVELVVSRLAADDAPLFVARDPQSCAVPIGERWVCRPREPVRTSHRVRELHLVGAAEVPDDSNRQPREGTVGQADDLAELCGRAGALQAFGLLAEGDELMALDGVDADSVRALAIGDDDAARLFPELESVADKAAGQRGTPSPMVDAPRVMSAPEAWSDERQAQRLQELKDGPERPAAPIKVLCLEMGIEYSESARKSVQRAVARVARARESVSLDRVWGPASTVVRAGKATRRAR